MARRSDHTREELKDMLLEESWKIVKKEGFEGLTARRLAKQIGYAPGTIYNLFASMDDLYLELNSQTLDKLYAALQGEGGKDPVQGMKAMAQRYRDFAHKFRPHWQMLFMHVMPEGRKAPPWYQDKVERLFEPLELLLEPYFTPAQARKRKMAARVLWASVHGLCFLEETGKISLVSNQEKAPDMAGYLIENFISGIEKSK